MIDLESRIPEIGQSLFTDAAAHRPRLLSARWWDEKMMDWSTAIPPLKIQLFRFVDALPVLQTPQTTNRHLREYVTEGLANWWKPAAAVAHLWPSDRFSSRAISALAHNNARRLAHRFIAASDVDAAYTAIADFRSRDLTATLDLLGEAVLSEHEAQVYQNVYFDLLNHLPQRLAALPARPILDETPLGPMPRLNLSVKLSSLYSQFDPIDPIATRDAVAARLRPILRLARQNSAFVNIDMEQFSYKDTTLDIFESILAEPEFSDWPDVGIAIQAYLKSCTDDLARLADFSRRRGTPFWIRLVKGAYWDYETVNARQNDWPIPVFEHKPETDANYEKQTAFLMANHTLLRPAIASHNVRSIASALALAEKHNLPPRSFEFQMLYGMADDLKSALVSQGHRVRVYAPVGALLPGMAYLVRRLLENTSNESFLRVASGGADQEKLLMNPLNLLSLKPAAKLKPFAPAAPSVQLFENEPLADFSTKSARSAMEAALRGVGGALGRTYPLVINGQRITTDKTIPSIDPARPDEIVGHIASASIDHANAAVAAAKSAFPKWRDTPTEKRAALLDRAGQIIRDRRYELSAWQVFETAKPWREADADVAETIDYCFYYAREARRLASPYRHDVPGERNETLHEPRGVTVTIAPWNFPLAILAGMTGAALVTGNTVIMKPAEQSSVIGALLMDIFTEAGFPPGVVNFLPGIGEEIGPTLVNHPDVATIAFTGSRSVGLSIQREASIVREGQTQIKHVLTELGGKNAVIVDDDADLDEAVHAVVASTFGYAGQKCSACSRAIVVAPIYDAFLARLIDAVSSLTVGPPVHAANRVGPVIDADAQQRILKTIAAADARKVYPTDNSPPVPAEGYFVPPTVFADVSENSPLAREEIFGPVLAVMKAADLTDAFRIANQTTPYALTGGIFSRSPATIERAKIEFRVGNLYINRKITGALVSRQPFGGFKLSGTGAKAGGPEYLTHFTLMRTITENTLRRGFTPDTAGE